MDRPGVDRVNSTKERVAALLGDVSAAGSFSARQSAPGDALAIEVRGVGPLQFPVPAAQARQLCGLARPARYGVGTRTLLDRRVRDTWEIPLSRVKIDKRRWNRTLQPVLERLRADLGLPSGSRFTAELHSMLVYRAGQFFVPHQDSEKSDEMVASLVVTLPSAFAGGSLVVEHRGKTAVYRASPRALSFVAFYADCRHEIKPVRTGHRIALTYNLLLRGGDVTDPAPASPATVGAVAGCLPEHFDTPTPRRSAGGAGDAPPNRLVYLLDHEYTERGIGWARLKGHDAARAAVLRAAADRAGCDVVLALADVHETWSCFEDDWDDRWSRRRSYRSWGVDDEDDDDGSTRGGDLDGYALDELVDWDITLTKWVGTSGEDVDPILTVVSDDELCATTPSVALQPYQSEYEGYMGNYGNTMDRWYRRAAVVVWPRQRAFAVRAEAAPGWAVTQLCEQLRTDVAGAREQAATLAPFWETVAGGEQRRRFNTDVLHVATALGDAELAAMMLRPFGVETLTPSDASELVAVVHQYGEAWTSELLHGWFHVRRRWPSGSADRPAWTASLPELGAALLATDPATGPVIGRMLLLGTWAWLDAEIGRAAAALPPSRRIEALRALAGPVLGFVSSASLIGSDDLREEAVRTLCVNDDEGLLACVVEVLRTAARAAPAAAGDTTGLAALREHGVRQLRARLTRPPRADDDWSIAGLGGCGCDVCVTLAEFLDDPARTCFEWPLAKDSRAHVHRTLDAHELPVHHETRRIGRPYTLVLTKTDALFAQERRSRALDQRNLDWLLAALDED